MAPRTRVCETALPVGLFGPKVTISLTWGPSEQPPGGCRLCLCVRMPACAWVRGLVRVAAASGLFAPVPSSATFSAVCPRPGAQGPRGTCLFSDQAWAAHPLPWAPEVIDRPFCGHRVVDGPRGLGLGSWGQGRPHGLALGL